jgi:hypothetical protein
MPGGSPSKPNTLYAHFLRNALDDGPHKVDDNCLDTGAGSEATRYLEMDHLQENKKEASGSGRLTAASHPRTGATPPLPAGKASCRTAFDQVAAAAVPIV